jgi:hypothetical protein
MASLQDALGQFNTDKPGWYGWTDSSLGMVYSNLKLNDETAVMPTEEEVNAKIAELEWEQNRISAYPQLGEQFDKLWHDINNGTLDNTGEFFTALKEVKDNNPKPGA